jgi:hypothetical protein
MHDIVIEMNSTLDKQTVENILKQFVEQQTGKSVSKIEATVNDNKFTGFHITYNSETPDVPSINNLERKHPVIIDKTFKPMIYY